MSFFQTLKTVIVNNPKTTAAIVTAAVATPVLIHQRARVGGAARGVGGFVGGIFSKKDKTEKAKPLTLNDVAADLKVSIRTTRNEMNEAVEALRAEIAANASATVENARLKAELTALKATALEVATKQAALNDAQAAALIVAEAKIASLTPATPVATSEAAPAATPEATPAAVAA